MKLSLITILLLISSCAHQSREYTKTTHFKEVGIICPNNYYFHYSLQKCVQHQKTPQYVAQVEFKAPIRLNNKAPKVKTGKKVQVSCPEVFKRINQCSI